MSTDRENSSVMDILGFGSSPEFGRKVVVGVDGESEGVWLIDGNEKIKKGIWLCFKYLKRE